MDASIRWNVLASLDTVFKRTRQRGVQLIPNGGSIAVRTLPAMFDFYGDQQCQYSPFGEMQTGILMFYSDRFVSLYRHFFHSAGENGCASRWVCVRACLLVLGVCVCVCVCVSVCLSVWRACVRAYLCVRERERER